MVNAETDKQKRTLLIVFALNLLLFVALGAAGVMAAAPWGETRLIPLAPGLRPACRRWAFRLRAIDGRF